MPLIKDKELYEKVKVMADNIYKKPSAYKSGFIVKKYKELGGTYIDDKKPKKLAQWFREDWGDIGNKEYPVYRPFKRVNKTTPLTKDEIDPKQALKQIKLKQKIKGEANLPPFQGKGIIEEDSFYKKKYEELLKYSNPEEAQKRAYEYLGKTADIYPSWKENKKYVIYNPEKDTYIHFGQIPYEDFLKHQNLSRRKNYLTRTAGIKGNWKEDKYSPNNLSRNILW